MSAMHRPDLIEEMREAERKRIAHELHDSVGQSLSAVKYTLERAIALLRQSRLDDPEPLLLRAVDTVQLTINELRVVAMNLRPAVLDDRGGASAVAWFCREFAETYPDIDISLELRVSDADVPERVGTAVLRSLQELLNNVAKHSKARTTCVSLHRRADTLTLEVADDGMGLPAPIDDLVFRYGRGLRNLHERAQMTGGQLRLSSRPSAGTVARIEWQLLSDEVD